MTTDLFDPASTGEMRLAPEVAETQRIEHEDHTINMTPYLAKVPLSPIPRYETDQHAELPSRCGVVLPDTTLDLRPPLPGGPPPPLPPTPPPVPIPGPPGWNGRVGIWPVTPGPRHALAGHASPVRPTRVQSRAWRRELSARDRRARAASVTLLLVLAGALVALWVVTR